MSSVEHLHLKHVLQTVGALEAVILRSFGPEGGQVLFTRDTGQLMLTRSGTSTLRALRLEHPVARMVVECVWKHTAKVGDGSKTFILMLASLLRIIRNTAFKELNVSPNYNSRGATEASTSKRLAEELLAFVQEKLGDVIAVGVVPHGYCLLWQDVTAKAKSTGTDCLQKLLASFFYTRLGRSHCDLMGDLICKLLAYWKFEKDLRFSSLRFINDNFSALHTPVSGFPINCSRLVEGQVIHRDFATPCLHTGQQPVKAVVLTRCLQPKLLNMGEVLELREGKRLMEQNAMNMNSVVQLSTWAEKSVERVIAQLRKLGVSVLLSAVKQSEAVLALATQAEICVVECISEDELSLVAHLSGATPVWDCRAIQSEDVATLAFCRPILLGAHRYVHVAFQDYQEDVVKPCSVIICGPGEGQTDQYAGAFQDALRMLHAAWEPSFMQSFSSKPVHTGNQNDRAKSLSTTTSPPQRCALEPGCVIGVGGTFEFLLHHALLKYGGANPVSNHTHAGVPVSQLLATALLCVPQQIYSQRTRRSLHVQTKVLSSLLIPLQPPPPQSGETSMHSCREATKDLTSSPGLESVNCKYQLVLAVVQCLTSLLRVDAVLHKHTASYTHACQLAEKSQEATEDDV